MRIAWFIFILSCCILSSCSSVQQLVYSPSKADNIKAVKTLLGVSASRALASVHNSSNNGMAGWLPEEVRPVFQTLKTLGLADAIDKIDQKVVVASTAISLESSSIMEDAIYQLEIGDAVAIIEGKSNAATAILKASMYEAVMAKYSRKMDLALADIEEMKHWDSAVAAYNLFANKKIDDSLSEMITKKAVDELFEIMGQKEAEIRNDLNLLGNEDLIKVFEYHVAP